MNLEVTQNNLYLFLAGKTSRVAQMYSKKHNVDLVDALKVVYNSNTYKKLAEEDTKFWHYGPVALFQELEENG